MKRARLLKLIVILALGILTLLIANTKGQNPGVTIRGTVFGASSPVSNATIALVEASSVAASSSIQPLEDLAATTPFKTRSDVGGNYAITLPPGRYFVYVIPDGSDGLHLPGGSASKIARDLPSGQSALVNIALSERPSPQANYVGTARCLSCHPEMKDALATKHFVGLRQPGKTSAIMDLGRLASLPRGFAGGVVADGNANGVNDFEERRSFLIGTVPDTLRITLGYLDNDRSGTLTNGDILTASFGGTTYQVWFVYGGSLYGNGRQVFITKLDDTQAPIPLNTTTPGSYYVLPFMYIEGNARNRRWQPSYSFSDWISQGDVKSPNPARTVDNQCIGCHATVAGLEGNRQRGLRAKIIPDPDGQFDYDNDGARDNINLTCETCHGPGSEHASQGRGRIVNPKNLGPAASTLLCGRCHLRGEGVAMVDGVRIAYPSTGSDSELRLPLPWILPSEFFGRANGEGIWPDFGTTALPSGFFNPMDFGTDDEHSWRDRRFGSRHNHSRWFYQDYQDFVRNRMYKNSFRLVNCFDCHDPHRNDTAATKGHQLRHRVTDNALCLGCHNGEYVRLGGFSNVTRAMVQQLEEGTQDQTVLNAIAADVLRHIKIKTFELVGASMNLPLNLYNPRFERIPVGRCTTCHMTRTITNGSEIVKDSDGFTISGVIPSHTFDIVSPLVAKGMAESGLDPIPNSCVVCHRGGDFVDEPDFRFKPP
jgi:predicted CXXCH cytochrome family protein